MKRHMKINSKVLIKNTKSCIKGGKMNKILKYRLIERNAEVKLYGLHRLFNRKFPFNIDKFLYQTIFNFEKIKYKYFNKIEIPQVEFVITTHCTLKCKDCVNYIPTIKDHIVLDYNQITNDIKKYTDAVDTVNNLILIGGEPLLHKDLSRIVEFCCNINKIKNLWVVSNGTIIPSEDLVKILKKYRNKTHFWISNYTKNPNLEKRLHDKEIIKILKSNKIRYIFNESLMWETTSDIKDNQRTPEEIRQYYLRCQHPCVSVIDGKITPCPRMSTYIVNKITDFNCNEDYVNIRNTTVEKIRKELIDFYKKDYFKGCNFCNFLEDFCKEKVMPAIQIGENT